MEGSTSPLSEGIQQALQAVEFEHIQQQYWAQNGCVVLEHFLPDEVLEHSLLPEAEKLRAHVHRNYIHRYKKGGSVSYYTLVEKAPSGAHAIPASGLHRLPEPARGCPRHALLGG